MYRYKEVIRQVLAKAARVTGARISTTNSKVQLYMTVAVSSLVQTRERIQIPRNCKCDLLNPPPPLLFLFCLLSLSFSNRCKIFKHLFNTN